MNRYRVVIQPSAERDINDAFEWISERAPAAAVRWFNRLEELLLSLETFPERAPLAPESEYLGMEVRELFHGRRQFKYRILFVTRGKEVHVLHVRHGSRRILGERE